MSSLAHKLGSVLESSAGQAASETASGNTKIGDTSYNNLSANKQDASSFFKGQGHRTEINDDGLSVTTSASGQVSYNSSGLTDNINTKFSVSEQEMNNVSSAVSSIESQTTNKAISSAVSNGFSVSSSDQYSQSEQDSIQKSMSFMKSSSEDLSKSTGLSQSQVLEASAGIGLGSKDKGFLSIASFNAKYGGSVTSDDSYRQLENFANSERFEEGMNYMKQNSRNESVTYADSSGKNVTSTMDEAMRKSEDYSNTLSNMEQISKIMSDNQTHKYIEHLHKNYDQHDVEGILNHKNNDYNDQRTESINSFMESQPSINKNNFNTENGASGSREFLHRFEDNLTHKQGYSNNGLAKSVNNMTKNADWNISNSEDRFDNEYEEKSSKVGSKTEMNVFSGAVDAGLNKYNKAGEYVKDIKSYLTDDKEE